MIFHWLDVTMDIEYGDDLLDLRHEGEQPFAVTLTFEEMKYLMHNPHYIHDVTYALSEEVPTNYQEVIQ